jgi:hypothetical protein
MSLCLVRFAQSKHIISKTMLAMLLFSLAALSSGTKEIAIISPALLAILDWFFYCRRGLEII